MDSELIAVCVVQMLVLALVVVAIIVYLLRNLMCRSRLDVTGRTLVITGCDSILGFDLARHYDLLGFRVYAGFVNPAGEAAVRLQADASSRLRIIPLDVTCSSSLVAAAKLVKEQLPPSERGKQSKLSIFFSSLAASIGAMPRHLVICIPFMSTRRLNIFKTLSNSRQVTLTTHSERKILFEASESLTCWIVGRCVGRVGNDHHIDCCVLWCC